MKDHIGVNVGSGYMTAVEGSSANVHDMTIAPKLICLDDKLVYGDSGYLEISKRDEVRGDTNFQIYYRINLRPGHVYRNYDNNGQA